ncbi:MAG: hypothetical protein JWO05_3938 [Gemmatimonadetes bacterium]|nr:hypothetical protein [Gemmatimonadota bacterium]
MNSDQAAQLLQQVGEIRKLLELLAEPAIAARDVKLRDELRRIVGSSIKKQQAVLLMNGTRTQKDVFDATGLHKGDLSTMVSKLDGAGLLIGEKKQPKLAISIPSNFFDAANDK